MRRMYDVFLGIRGQRTISRPAINLAIGTDHMADLPMQFFPRRGLVPPPVPKIMPVKYQSGAKIGRELLQAIRGLDKVRPEKEC